MCGMGPVAIGKVHGVDPTAVSEAPAVDPAAVGKDPAVDPTAVGEATTVQAWRRSRSGCVSGREMIVGRGRV
jgi:hypothetical protein